MLMPHFLGFRGGAVRFVFGLPFGNKFLIIQKKKYMVRKMD